MPRRPRILIAHQPHHIVQRGHRRQGVLHGTADHRAYLRDLRAGAGRLGVAVHAWCLMPNHVHLLLTPGDDPRTLSTLVQHVARRATRRWNARRMTAGSIWEARFKSQVIDEERYLLQCCRYIELNPVRARLVCSAEDYLWSSYRERMGMAPAGLLDLHASYLAMGRDDDARRAAYRCFMQEVSDTLRGV